ncbi:nuclear pore complex protein DDB_G0274915 isoform X1 [Anopheles gambiae]|uniref:nuclear pore complex protein DDB_G0274915 isoform X1 n=1 Tax=Anopheles gambiae TaxID=7165 RepID=UPI002AC8BF4D|nr:nuclear pore complex protein DDB_G0274915 isoform X1 [Anopheles gambiae]XP_061500284.1 nuclear pore complex protein DDB_G0274915 isoform X1 [Anopheles gambiae]XP_061500285.1 nuclear pore complex protein DDB_G0274915 isoform X1 [Anopheles gambiae]XP_061500286.1 nuclear pore complex protein DDB_G0274915 isoform X1 [Anopheles gambiae]XP_061500287.1 nuclear pore complex protein DDB_G0274915 isoform X1 [Anopheles gambiae]XP_061500288.1 nuclear pore complex protein DDB_G0274915 isoform X1 [Anophe
MSAFKMTMTKAHILCILWMIIFFCSSSTVNAAQRDAIPKQQHTASTKDSSSQAGQPGNLLTGSSSSSSGSGSSSSSSSSISSSSSVSSSTSTSSAGSSGSSSSSSSISTTSSSSSSGSAATVGASSSSSSRPTNVETTAQPTEQSRVGPYFDVAASKNVTALLGKTAYLNCRVKNLGNKTMLLQVSWVRHRDIHLLTVGRYTYTSDQRFRAIHHPHTEDWSLQIKYPQHRDSGIYECQISTTPHMSHFVHLNVIEPSTEIIGAPDLYIESGSTINLTCVVKDSPEPPAYIFWNHNNAIISYDSPRGGVSVITEKGDTTTSFLLIQNARPSDSGQYTCNPSNAKSKSVTVHVLNGVSHSVSRGVPSSNAARGTTASSRAAQPSALGAGLGACLVLALLHRYAAAAEPIRWWPTDQRPLAAAATVKHVFRPVVVWLRRTVRTRIAGPSAAARLRLSAHRYLPIVPHRTCPPSTRLSSRSAGRASPDGGCPARPSHSDPARLEPSLSRASRWHHHNHRWRTDDRSGACISFSQQSTAHRQRLSWRSEAQLCLVR